MLTLTSIAKTYPGQTPALHGVNLSVDRGEIVCLLGPSGCGKTTLLRIVAGLETADQGKVKLDGRDLAATPVYRRQFGFMFQEFALFPHQTVGENIAFGLRMLGQTGAQIEQRVAEMLTLVNLPGYARRSIFEISGGERQRVALARSLAPNPRLLLLDEPLGSLDRTLREALMIELRTILKKLGMTALYVTHDQQEALVVADRLVVMQRGRLEQIGTPAQIYRQPATPFVAGFLGFHNLLPAQVDRTAPSRAKTKIGDFALSVAYAPGEYTLLIRPQAATLDPISPAEAQQMILAGQLVNVSFRGDHYQVQIAMRSDSTVHVLTFTVPMAASTNLEFRQGDVINFTLDPAWLTLLPTQAGQR